MHIETNDDGFEKDNKKMKTHNKGLKGKNQEAATNLQMFHHTASCCFRSKKKNRIKFFNPLKDLESKFQSDLIMLTVPQTT